MLHFYNKINLKLNLLKLHCSISLSLTSLSKNDRNMNFIQLQKFNLSHFNYILLGVVLASLTVKIDQLISYMRFEVLMVVMILMLFFSVITPCGLAADTNISEEYTVSVFSPSICLQVLTALQLIRPTLSGREQCHQLQ